MTLKNQVLSYIANFPGATDTEMEKYFDKLHQTINQTCRALEKEGLLIRRKNPAKGNLIGNYPASQFFPDTSKENPVLSKNFSLTSTQELSLQEEDIKHILADYLEENGWSARVAWGHSHGIDIDAHRENKRWIIEVKGPGSRQPMRVNYFVSILGEMLQRMNDPNARYTIAFPDIPQYRGLWDRLPQLAKDRTGIDMLLVHTDGTIEFLK